MIMTFDRYQITIQLTEPVLGTVPTDSMNYEQFIKPKANVLMSEEEIKVLPTYHSAADMRRRAAADAKRAKGKHEDDDEDDDTGISKPQTSFFRDAHGPFLMNYQVLGHLKEQGNLLKEQLQIKQLRKKVELYCYVAPRRIYFNQDVAGEITRPLRAETMQGPRVTLATSDVIARGARLTFGVNLLRNTQMDGETLRTLLEFGQFRGLGQWRTAGWGLYELVEFVAVDDKEERSGVGVEADGKVLQAER